MVSWYQRGRVGLRVCDLAAGSKPIHSRRLTRVEICGGRIESMNEPTPPPHEQTEPATGPVTTPPTYQEPLPAPVPPQPVYVERQESSRLNKAAA